MVVFGRCLDPSTSATVIEKPVSQIWQVELTVASNGDVVPDPPTAAREIVLLVGVSPQSILTVAVTVVPADGASTWFRSWSLAPTLPPAISREICPPE